jgi:hypothetical protein
MIAAGLCMMGGCFAQMNDSSVVDAYWPAEKIAIPRSSSRIGIYEYDSIPAGIAFEQCRVYTKQYVHSGEASFFFVFQNDHVVYNAFSSLAWGGKIFIEFYNGVDIGSAEKEWAQNGMAIFTADSTGARYIEPSNLESPAAFFDESQPCSRLRLLDARGGEKDFYVTHGSWGLRWYVLPMQSVARLQAVFDFEQKVLVEI